jgi:hypothetical protein
MAYSGAWRKLIHEKNQKSKLSWHCPFRNTRIGFIYSQPALGIDNRHPTTTTDSDIFQSTVSTLRPISDNQQQTTTTDR